MLAFSKFSTVKTIDFVDSSENREFITITFITLAGTYWLHGTWPKRTLRVEKAKNKFYELEEN